MIHPNDRQPLRLVDGGEQARAARIAEKCEARQRARLQARDQELRREESRRFSRTVVRTCCGLMAVLFLIGLAAGWHRTDAGWVLLLVLIFGLAAVVGRDV